MEANIRIVETGGGQRQADVAPSGRVTVRTAGELKAILAGALAVADMVRLDLSGITDADSAALQLLLSARKSAEESGRRIVLSPKPSAAFTDEARTAGFNATGIFEAGDSPGEE
jgi:anti-anti-sigma regulatory factor